MEDIGNARSEDELLRLRDEGKISRQEYQELLAAMRKSPSNDPQLGREPELIRLRKRLLTYSFVVSLIGLPVGLAMNLPYVWGLSIAGIIVAGNKLSRIKDSWLANIVRSVGQRRQRKR
jgi:hypothetical protein